MKPKPPMHILLVDDDRLVLATLAASLTRAGYQVTRAESAEEAEEFLAGGRRPDLVIVDVRMPGEGGLYLAQRLREFDHIPFVMLSAFSDTATVNTATQQGALGYLVKPLGEAQLLPAVEAALARATEINALRTTHKQLQAALDSDRNINVAVGITMVQYRVARTVAFELLRKNARSRSLRLARVAAEVVELNEKLSSAADG